MSPRRVGRVLRFRAQHCTRYCPVGSVGAPDYACYNDFEIGSSPDGSCAEENTNYGGTTALFVTSRSTPVQVFVLATGRHFCNHGPAGLFTQEYSNGHVVVRTAAGNLDVTWVWTGGETAAGEAYCYDSVTATGPAGDPVHQEQALCTGGPPPNPGWGHLLPPF